MTEYDHDYVIFDDFGIREVKCMCCGQTVAGVTYDEVPSRAKPGIMEKVRSYRYHSNLRYKEVLLADGSYADLMICQDCVNKTIDFKKVSIQIVNAKAQELVAAGKSVETVNDFLRRSKNLEVVHCTNTIREPAKFKSNPNAKDPQWARKIVEDLKAKLEVK